MLLENNNAFFHNKHQTQSLNFYNTLKPFKGADNVSYELLVGAGHGGPQFFNQLNVAKVIAFFGKNRYPLIGSRPSHLCLFVFYICDM